MGDRLSQVDWPTSNEVIDLPALDDSMMFHLEVKVELTQSPTIKDTKILYDISCVCTSCRPLPFKGPVIINGGGWGGRYF